MSGTPVHDDPYVAGFLAGQAVAYCEMVSRGVRLAGQLDVPSDACEALVALVQQEGCRTRVLVRDGRAAIWVYRYPQVERLIEALETSLPIPSEMAIWGMGKLLGYDNLDVLAFLASTSTSPAESNPLPCLDKRGSDMG